MFCLFQFSGHTKLTANVWSLCLVADDSRPNPNKNTQIIKFKTNMDKNKTIPTLSKTAVSSSVLPPQLCKDCNNFNNLKDLKWTSKICGECFFYDNNQQSNFKYKLR